MSESNIEDDYSAVQVILQWRIYDALTLLLRNVNPDEAEAMIKVHERGGFITPQPSLNLEATDG